MKSPFKIANRSLEELDKIMCEAIGVDHKDFLKMDWMDQSKVHAKYMLKVHGKKQRQLK